MGRHRKNDVGLPPHVHRVRAGARVYFYYQPSRGTGHAGARVRLSGDPHADPASPAYARFWAELSAAAAGAVAYPAKSLGSLVTRYRADDAFLRLAEQSQAVYAVHLNRIAHPERWGLLDPDRLTPLAVMAARDGLVDTPGMANQMLSIGRTLFDWAIPLGLAASNPFTSVPALETTDAGHVPWPAWAVEYALAHMPPDLVRMVRLGVMTCQRESDLIRMSPEHREHVRGRPGIWCRPRKTRRHRKTAAFIPLAITDALELDRWAGAPLVFTNSRFKAPVERHRVDLYLYSPKGDPYSTTSLRARYHRWLATPAGAEMCRRWRAWLTEIVARYEWDFDPTDHKGPTIHGLRGTGILARFAEGYDESQIGNDIGAHPRTVGHYMRFRDQMEVAAAGRERLRLVSEKD